MTRLGNSTRFTPHEVDEIVSASFIMMKPVGRRKAQSVAVMKIVVEIDPYSDRDRLSVE